ncbi:divergent polysaccharide deacetylase family protein [Photobacterium sp. SDRW27]|uniref:divergent polysaccharide deacetylase family protein n=1 Tax=Photobacterium obscurum TaxID=2829490 RepID=UPI00224450F8|nr:divergent polysaccharide deacetylase family protein [Photobacterium obscurum]MCW8329592.1 divergent polysaccharide deacetylase family protein [Photobacterium obscurum]
MRRTALWFSLLLGLLAHGNLHAARLAIVIDDLGYRAMPAALSDLPAEVSISILPDTPFDLATAQKARQEQRDTLLHMPMQPQHRAPLELTTLTAEMTQDELQQTLRHALSRVPGAVAMNNHMGSALTQNIQAMDWVMAVLDEQGIYFLDSRTTAKSVALKQARALGIPALRRHIFLDHFQTQEFVQQQFKLAIKRAQRNGYAIAIGHPYPVTLATLEAQLPELEKHNVRLVRLSSLYPAP